LAPAAERAPDAGDGRRPARAEARVELACLELRGRVVAIELAYVREIVRAEALVPLPHAPRLIEGVMELRGGGVVPVVDLGRALDGEPLAPARGQRVALVEVEGLRFGLRVEAAVDVLAVDASQVEPTPALATQAGYTAVRGIVRREGKPPALILCLEHLLASLERPGVEEARP
jgi:purine-binding chemotaxis protein CheW